jgi:hypothetical protein
MLLGIPPRGSISGTPSAVPSNNPFLVPCKGYEMGYCCEGRGMKASEWGEIQRWDIAPPAINPRIRYMRVCGVDAREQIRRAPSTREKV